MKAIKLFASAAVMAGVLIPANFTMAAGSYTEDLTGPQGSPNGTILFSDEFTNTLVCKTCYLARNAFDNVIDTNYWNANAPTGHIGYEFAQPQTITKYTMRWSALTGWQHYMPRDWTFEALDTVTNVWVVLDSRTNVTDWSGSEKKEFTFSNTRSYKSYRIKYTKSNSTYTLSGIGEIEMMASLPTTPTVQFDVDVSDSSLYGIEDVDAYVVSRNATGLKTEEVTVSYDQEAFFLGEITPEPGFTILSTDTSTPGQIKVKLSSSGATFSTTAETRMFKIAMKSRAVNKTARIETSAGFATDSAGNVLPVIFGGENIALTYKVGDVNLDGYITVADLAMAASTYGSYTHLMSFADVNGDELVDDTDLALIAGLIQKPVIADGGYGYSMDLTQGGSARASSSHWNYNYYQPKFAFDGDTTSGFYWNAGTKVPSGWLEYDLRIRQMPVNKYSLLWQLHTGFESYMPKDWTFEGWDGWNQSWVVLDSKQGVTNWVTGNKQEFTFENNVAYDKYRINISASNNASYVGVGEMEMFSKIGASPAVGLDITRVDAAAGGAWNVAQGETFDASLIVHNYGNMQAEDATVTFDTNKLEFVEAVPVRAGVKIVKQDSSVPGKLRFVLANTGQTEDLNPGERTQLIKLTFKVKEGASGWVNLSMPLDSAWVGNWYGADFNATEQGAGLEVVQR